MAAKRHRRRKRFKDSLRGTCLVVLLPQMDTDEHSPAVGRNQKDFETTKHAKIRKNSKAEARAF